MYLKSFIVVCLFAQAEMSYAEVVNTRCETGLSCLVENNTNTANTNPGYVQGTVGYVPPETTNNFGSAGSSRSGAYSQAHEAKDQANNTMMMSLAMAAMFASQCSSSNPTACMLAAAAAAAAMMANQKKQEAKDVMNSLGSSGQTPGTVDTSNKTDAALNSDLSGVLADLKRQGYGVDGLGNVTLPNGNTVAGDMSRQSMLDAGMSAAQANGVLSGLDRMRKDFKDKMGQATTGLAGDGSGGYGRGSISSLEEGGSKESTGANAEAERNELNRDPAAWAGFYKKFGSDVIGVGLSDIFKAVEDRVQKERVAMGH